MMPGEEFLIEPDEEVIDEASAPSIDGQSHSSQVESPTTDPPPVDASRSTARALAARATEPELGELELRQIAGLTSGLTMPLEAERYDFAQGGETAGFHIEVDDYGNGVVIPGSAKVKVDAVELSKPTTLDGGALDVGSARFLLRHRLVYTRATDWLGRYDTAERGTPQITVPAGLDDHSVDRSEAAGKSKKPKKEKRSKRRSKRAAKSEESGPPPLIPLAKRFVKQVRSTRVEIVDRERYFHPDPAELADRAAHRAPILGIRPPGHPLFAKVAVVAADLPWVPAFDDINAIPDSLGDHLKPLMTLPSMPVVADLMVGPLGIVGARMARLACARNVVLSLYGLSTSEMPLHLAATDPKPWAWADGIFHTEPIDIGAMFPVVVVDGPEAFESCSVTHADAIEHRAGALILADAVEDLPSYCGTVLQVDNDGGGLLTNHLGNIISGTPIGVTTPFAERVGADLLALMARRRNR